MSFSTVALAAMTMMTMATVTGCYGFREIVRTPRFNADATRFFYRSREGENVRGQMEPCRPTNLRKDRLGRVNVFAFLDPSWHYSYRQAIMLELLKKRLEKSAFSDILFFVVTPPSNLPEDNRENDMEIKTWKEVSKNILESEYFLDATESMFNDVEKNKMGITVLQDNPELSIWKNFRVSKDEVVIVNRCGQLTYQVIVPWSILYFPYVKAAILSTYNEDPCGPCEEQSSTTHYNYDYEEFVVTTVDKDETTTNRNLNSHTERTFADLTTTTISVGVSKEFDDENNTNIITTLNSNSYERKMYNTTISDLPNTPIEASESMRVEAETFVTETNIVAGTNVATDRDKTHMSTAIPIFETTENYGELPHRVSSLKEINTNNKNSFLTVNNLYINRESNYEDRGPHDSLKNMNEDKAGADTKQELKLQDESLPLRIILYAPHLHRENGTLKKYTHVVLKTGSPGYHNHFHSKTVTSDQEPPVIKKSDSALLNDKELSEYLHGRNESPGVYGEIADYWRTTDEEERENKDENVELTDYDYAGVEDIGSDVSDASDIKSAILQPNDMDIIESDTNIKSNDEIDDFVRSRLIEHYNKLLAWISYML